MSGDRQPPLPFARGSDTSRAAADSMREHAGAQRRAVLALFRSAGSRGLTCDEAEELSGKRHQSISARVRELARDGEIVRTEERRPTRSGRMAHVYLYRRPWLHVL